MKNEVLFFEEQRFTQWWIYACLIGINSIFFYGVYIQIFQGKPFGNNPMSNTMLLVTAAIIFTSSSFFLYCRLRTRIQEDGIYVGFSPFGLKCRYIPWDQVDQTYVRKYKPISEFGGWGYKTGMFRCGKAYSTSGNWGLQLKLKNGKKLLIGTHRPEEIEAVLQKLQKDTNSSLTGNF